MNPVFNTLTRAILDDIEEQLSNCESVDEDLWDFFVDDLGLTAEQADAALALRAQYQAGIPIDGSCLLLQKLTLSSDIHEKKVPPQRRLNYDQILDAYRMLLQSRPGQRLRLGTHWAAGINTEGRLYCTPICPEDPEDLFEVFDFDREAFVHDHWQCETLAQTHYAIENPEFI